ncbi:MAG TPA: hypothetical protein VHL11_25000, partial [Phototrophicaceae bacterium]|nr:hypothetical protein [Phototrophicaceae bacterium]
MVKSKIPSPEELLAAAFHFDDTALSANRDSRLSPLQRKQLTRFRDFNFLTVAAYFMIAVWLLISSTSTRHDNSGITILMIISFALILRARPIYISLNLLKDFRQDQISSIEGIIELQITGSARAAGPNYNLKIQD